MRNVILACVMAASLAGCSWWHGDRDRNMQSSGSTAPPVSQAQSEQQSPQGAASNATATDWSKCDEHPYTPGPRTCK